MPTAKQLREERAKLVPEVRKLADLIATEKRDFTAEEKTKWDAVNADVDRLKRSIDALEKAEDHEAYGERDAGRPDVGRDDVNAKPKRSKGAADGKAGPTEETRAVAIQGWFRSQLRMGLRDNHKSAMRDCGVDGRRELRLKLASTQQFRNLRRESRAQGVATNAAGAYTVQPGFMASLETALLKYGGIRERADVIRTDTGVDLPWPTMDDTSNEGAIVAENTDVGAEQAVTFGSTTLKCWKYQSKPVKISYELLNDSAFNMAAELGAIMGERLGRITNRHYIVGDNSSKPQGITVGATVGVTAASATAITMDEVLNLIHSVDPSYRENASFILHDNVLLALRKLKDSQGRYLWEPSPKEGAPDRLWKYAYDVNQHMPSAIATTAKTIVFGDVSKYKIRDVGEIRIKRLSERYAELDQEAFLGFLRTDGRLLDAGTHPVKVLQQA